MANTDNKININDSWKNMDSVYINVGDDWKSVSEAWINVGDEWKQWWTARVWLEDWAKRKKVTISGTNIDENLTHFPVPIFLNSAAGIDGNDTTDIFTEVGANYSKIAVTKGDGLTQLYVEVDSWDDTSNSGIIWVSKSDWTLSSGTDTELYIYFDSNKTDNTSYVGTATDSITDNVWDSNFTGVWHLKENSAGSVDEFKDSTTYANHGQGEGQATSLPTVASGGPLHNCQYFDGGSRINFGSDSSLDNYGPLTSGTGLTFSCWFKMPSLVGNAQRFFEKRAGNDDVEGKNFYISANTTNPRFVQNYDVSQFAINCDDGSFNTNEWVHIFTSWDGNSTSSDAGGIMYVNGSSVETGGSSGSTTPRDDVNGNFYLADRPDGNRSFEGYMDEARFSNSFRTPAWAKAEYNSGIDNIMTFSATETY